MTEGRSQSARKMTKRDKYPADLHGLEKYVSYVP